MAANFGFGTNSIQTNMTMTKKMRAAHKCQHSCGNIKVSAHRQWQRQCRGCWDILSSFLGNTDKLFVSKAFFPWKHLN